MIRLKILEIINKYNFDALGKRGFRIVKKENKIT